MMDIKDMLCQGCSACGADDMIVDYCGVKCVACGHHFCMVQELA